MVQSQVRLVNMPEQQLTREICNWDVLHEHSWTLCVWGLEPTRHESCLMSRQKACLPPQLCCLFFFSLCLSLSPYCCASLHNPGAPSVCLYWLYQPGGQKCVSSCWIVTKILELDLFLWQIESIEPGRQTHRVPCSPCVVLVFSDKCLFSATVFFATTPDKWDHIAGAQSACIRWPHESAGFILFWLLCHHPN